MRSNKKVLTTSTLALAMSLLSACGGGSSGGGTPPVETGRTYTVQDQSFDTLVTIKSTSFTATQQGGNGYTYSGDVVAQPLGLLKLTMTASTDPADAASLPKVLYAREVPDAMFIMADSTTNTGNGYENATLGIALGGNCGSVTAGSKYQGIILADPAADRVVNDFWVTATATTGSSGMDLTLQPYKLTEDYQSIPAAGTVSLLDLACAGSPTMGNVGGDVVTVAPSGLIMVTTATMKAILVPEATGVVSTDISTVGRAFSGISAHPNAGADTNYGTADDFMAVDFFLLNGDYHTYSGSNDTLTGQPITDIPNAGTDPTQAGQMALKQSAGTGVPAGLFDATGVPVKTGTNGRMIAHVLPNGSYMILGYAEDPGATLQDQWTGFITAEYLAPPTIPAQLTTGNSYSATISEGPQNNVLINIDTTAGQFMGIGDTGQIFWGSASTMSSGFIKMVASGTTNPKDRGTSPVLYTFEMPDSIAMIIPADSYDAIEQGYMDDVTGFDVNGSCLAAGGSVNMIHTPDGQAFDQTASGAFGVGSAATGAVTGIDLTGAVWLLAENMSVASGGGTLSSMLCYGGNVLTNGTAFAVSTASGLTVLDTDGTGNDVFAMLPQGSVSAATLTANAMNYRGVVIRPHDNGDGTWGSVREFISANGDGANIVGRPYTDVEAGTQPVGQDGTISLSQSGSASPGMFDTATLTTGGVTTEMRMMAYLDTSGGKNKHVLVGMAQSDTNGMNGLLDPKDYIFIVLMEQ